MKRYKTYPFISIPYKAKATRVTSVIVKLYGSAFVIWSMYTNVVKLTETAQQNPYGSTAILDLSTVLGKRYSISYVKCAMVTSDKARYVERVLQNR